MLDDGTHHKMCLENHQPNTANWSHHTATWESCNADVYVQVYMTAHMFLSVMSLQENVSARIYKCMPEHCRNTPVQLLFFPTALTMLSIVHPYKSSYVTICSGIPYSSRFRFTACPSAIRHNTTGTRYTNIHPHNNKETLHRDYARNVNHDA
jgi:hypothetical protein